MIPSYLLYVLLEVQGWTPPPARESHPAPTPGESRDRQERSRGAALRRDHHRRVRRRGDR